MIKRRIRLTSRAADDLTEIYLSLAAENPPAAERLVAYLATKIASAAELGLTGTAVEGLDATVRRFVIRDHYLFARVTETHLVVLGVRHARRQTLSDHVLSMVENEKSEDS